MSSWIRAKGSQQKKKPAITKYHDTSLSKDIFSMYLNYIGAFIYTQRLSETCNVWDAPGLIKDSLKLSPQVKILREKPEVEPTPLVNYMEVTLPLKLKDVQKIASGLIVYQDDLNRSVIRILEKAGIKNIFDIGIHLTVGIDATMQKKYADLIRSFQLRAKKEKLTLYIMADSYNLFVEFQKLCDPSWKVSSLSKNVPRDSDETFIQLMAEVQIMTALPALVLDFNKSADRFIYLMQRNPKMDYFVEVNSMEWALISPAPVPVAVPAPVPVPVPAAVPVHVAPRVAVPVAVAAPVAPTVAVAAPVAPTVAAAVPVAPRVAPSVAQPVAPSVALPNTPKVV
jgi:hypothetical protein